MLTQPLTPLEELTVLAFYYRSLGTITCPDCGQYLTVKSGAEIARRSPTTVGIQCGDPKCGVVTQILKVSPRRLTTIREFLLRIAQA